jgi:hypothetical protein
MQLSGFYILERRFDPGGRSVWTLNESGALALTWLTWGTWLICVALRLSRTVINLTDPNAPGQALTEYLGFMHSFWSGEPLYLPDNLHGFHYLPVMLMLSRPLSWVDRPVAGAAIGLASIGLLGWSVCVLARQLVPDHPFVGAGTILAASSMTSIFCLWLLNLQMLMVAAMIAAATKGMRGNQRGLVLWLVIAIAIKPLAIVMAMLAAAAIPKTRIPLIVAVAALLLLPFAFWDWSYLGTEYVNYIRQLWHITSAPPHAWQPQVDVSTMLNSVGLHLGTGPRLAIRLVAALGTLVLALRIAALGDERATALALLVLSTSYVALFNPRQEEFSFLVVVPAFAAVSMLFLGHDLADWRGWGWLLLALLVGARWGDVLVRWLVPGAVVLAWIGLLCLMLDPKRWRNLVSRSPDAPPDFSGALLTDIASVRDAER